MTTKAAKRVGAIGLGLWALTVALGCESGPSPGQGSGEKPSPQADQARPSDQAVEKLGVRLVMSEQTSVADLLAHPKKYEGKTVRVAGEVEDFCHHRRAWFAISADDGEGMIRVFAVPKFRAPADCKGKHAVAEGKVEVRTLTPEQVEHFGKEHVFLKGVKVEEGKPVYRPVIMALGAEFR